jgi:hypothetical protein
MMLLSSAKTKKEVTVEGNKKERTFEKKNRRTSPSQREHVAQEELLHNCCSPPQKNLFTLTASQK